MIKQASIILAVLAAACGTANAEVQETGYRQMTGTKNILAIRVQFPDMPNPNSYATTVNDLAIAADRTHQKSYNRLTIVPTVTSGLYTLPHNKAYYAAKPIVDRLEALRTDSVTLAQANGYPVSPTDYQNYDRVSIMLPQGYGLNTFTHHTQYISSIVPTALLHEWGHSWLFAHAGLWVVSDGNPVSPSGHSMEYGDPFDIMAQSYSTLYDKLDYNMFFKYWAGWLDDNQIAVSDQTGTYTYTIRSFDNVNATGLVAIKVAAGSDFDYWIGYRRGFLNATDATKTSAHAAYIIRTCKAPQGITKYNNLFNRPELIDTQTPGTVPGDACLPIGKTLTDSVHGISITTVAEGTGSLTIQVVRQ